MNVSPTGMSLPDLAEEDAFLLEGILTAGVAGDVSLDSEPNGLPAVDRPSVTARDMRRRSLLRLVEAGRCAGGVEFDMTASLKLLIVNC